MQMETLKVVRFIPCFAFRVTGDQRLDERQLLLTVEPRVYSSNLQGLRIHLRCPFEILNFNQIGAKVCLNLAQLIRVNPRGIAKLID